MQKVLRKRVLRDLKKNFFRYLALGLMIAMGIFLVVTIVGSAETLTKGTEDLAEKTNLEDGEFEVFVPLSKNDKNHCARHHKCLHYQKAVMYILQFNFHGTSLLPFPCSTHFIL